MVQTRNFKLLKKIFDYDNYKTMIFIISGDGTKFR